jgi:hypothetical protein
MRKGARLKGKASSGELLINFVTCDPPKMLTGGSQKGTWLDNFCLVELQGHRTTGRKAEPNPFLLLKRNTVSPTLCLQRQADRKEG